MFMVRMRSKTARTAVALVATLAWAYGPMFPASLCIASGTMAAAAAEPATHCHPAPATHEAPVRHEGCRDVATSCCLRVTPDDSVGAASPEPPAPATVVVPFLAVSRLEHTFPTGESRPEISPPKKEPPSSTSVLRL